jgi:hypothetical protein
MDKKGSIGAEGSYDVSLNIVDTKIKFLADVEYSLGEVKDLLVGKGKAAVYSFLNGKILASPDMNVIERKVFESLRDLVAPVAAAVVVADAPAAPAVASPAVSEGPAPAV